MAAILAIETREVEAGKYHMYLVYKADSSSTWEALHGFSSSFPTGTLLAFHTADLSNTSEIAEGDERGGTQAELDARGHQEIATGSLVDSLWEAMKDQCKATLAMHA